MVIVTFWVGVENLNPDSQSGKKSGKKTEYLQRRVKIDFLPSGSRRRKMNC
jgi:hypothetical protein